jgi:hypothetical protein
MALAILLIVNSMIYFTPNASPAFLIEKSLVQQIPVWRAAFYFHVVSACICLAAGFALFFPWLLQFRRLHFSLGYIYLNAVLWFAAPSGLIMAPFAKGGFFGALGFIVTGAAWWWTTWSGYRAIRRGQVRQHVQWMVHSYSLALSAVFFRVIQMGLGWMQVDPQANYVASLWLSMVASIWLARTCNVANASSGYGRIVGFNSQIFSTSRSLS